MPTLCPWHGAAPTSRLCHGTLTLSCSRRRAFPTDSASCCNHSQAPARATPRSAPGAPSKPPAPSLWYPRAGGKVAGLPEAGQQFVGLHGTTALAERVRAQHPESPLGHTGTHPPQAHLAPAAARPGLGSSSFSRGNKWSREATRTLLQQLPRRRGCPAMWAQSLGSSPWHQDRPGQCRSRDPGQMAASTGKAVSR